MNIGESSENVNQFPSNARLNEHQEQYEKGSYSADQQDEVADSDKEMKKGMTTIETIERLYKTCSFTFVQTYLALSLISFFLSQPGKFTSISYERPTSTNTYNISPPSDAMISTRAFTAFLFVAVLALTVQAVPGISLSIFSSVHRSWHNRIENESLTNFTLPLLSSQARWLHVRGMHERLRGTKQVVFKCQEARWLAYVHQLCRDQWSMPHIL